MDHQVVEFLSFDVAASDRAAWLEADSRVWTSFLRQQPGFVSKQVWIDRDEPGIVHTAIVWTDEVSWKSIPAVELDRVDQQMGEWRRPFTERVFDVVSAV